MTLLLTHVSPAKNTFGISSLLLLCTAVCARIYSKCACCGLDGSKSLLFYIGRMSEPSTSCGRPGLAQCNAGESTLDKLSHRKRVYPLEYACIFMLACTEADANEDVRQLYN